MPLDIQINSLIFSFAFGIFFSLFLTLNHKIIYNSKKIIKFVGTALVVFSSVLLFFVILLNINNATFHPYELIMIVLGFYIENLIHQKLKRKKKLKRPRKPRQRSLRKRRKIPKRAIPRNLPVRSRQKISVMSERARVRMVSSSEKWILVWN